MISEILDAIKEQYKDDPDIMGGCYLLLGGLCEDKNTMALLAGDARQRLYEMRRCAWCGEPLRYKMTYQSHGEGMMEPMYEAFCPYHGEDYI